MYPAKHDLYKMLIKITDILIFFFHKTVFCVFCEPVSLLAMYVARQLTPAHKPLHANKGVELSERVHATKLYSTACTAPELSTLASHRS
jgi:hypothetical protein